jgi:modulator of FtsH protease HflC
MKRKYLTLSIGFLLLVVFGLLLFSFQVRQTEIALVTLFGKPVRSINVNPDQPEPGLYGKLPWPIEKVLKFDKRVQDFEGKDRLEETLTQDRRPLLIRVYAGWAISTPALFRERFGGSIEQAQIALDGLVRSAKTAVVGQHPFAHFISPDETQVHITDIEKEILTNVQATAKANYGIDVRFLGIERLGLPESITQKVFETMKKERQRVVERLQAEGDAQASAITSAANRDATNILSSAEARVIEIRGQADAEAAQAFAIFKQNPEFALFLVKLKALEDSAKNRTTLILDERTPPFDLLDGAPKNVAAPAAGK